MKLRRACLLLAAVAVVAALLVAAVPSASRHGDASARVRDEAGASLSAPAAASAANSRRPDAAPRAAQSSVSVLPGSARLPAAQAPRGADAGTAPLPPVAADASQSLVDALRDGDARSPPIAASPLAPEPANAAELADPAAYRRYERRQQARLYRAFEQEASIALADLQRDLARGRAAALPAGQIAEGEDKQRKLAETLERLRRGELDQP